MARRRDRRRDTRRPQEPSGSQAIFEAEVAEGLEALAAEELSRRLRGHARLRHPPTRPLAPGSVRFTYGGDPRALFDLRTVISVYRSLRFGVPRPKALLGDQAFRELVAGIEAVRALSPPGSYEWLYLSAAGADSPVMVRLKEALAAALGLRVASDEGDLLLRVRRPIERGEGWEVLVRLTPRPLATRAWRVCNLEGALNATVAHAMMMLTAPTQSDVVLNGACGSGTLLIERRAMGRAARLIGCDVSPAALACARENVTAAGYAAQIELHPWDARALPLPDASVDVYCADLPFGQLVGSHDENVALYPALLAEAARVVRPGGPAVLITHEVRLLESLLADSEAWRTEQVRMVTLGGLHPRLYLLRRR